MRSRILGTGSYLPEAVLTNSDLEKRMDTSDAWIRERTGIERRHVARGRDHRRYGRACRARRARGGRLRSPPRST